MLMIHCPYCNEARDEEEFSFAGEANIIRPKNLDEISDRTFAEYLYFRNNIKGLQEELWVHTAACRKYFKVMRDTLTYTIYESQKISQNKNSESKSIKRSNEVLA